MKLLGIGSRIKHVEYGLGVVTNLTAQHYWVTFFEKGLETIDIDSEFEVVEALENDDIDTVSLYEVEKSLKNILQKWTGIAPAIGMAEKWKGGKLILEPSTNVQSKEMPTGQTHHKFRIFNK